jgi:hypothetical protein
MLAAHRAGGRSNVIGFALAWDRFALGRSGRVRPRPATERELMVLKVYLQASLLASPVPAEEVGAGRARIGQAAASTRAPRDDGPQRDDWAWPSLERAYDDYELALAHLEPEQPVPAVEPEPVLS